MYDFESDRVNLTPSPVKKSHKQVSLEVEIPPTNIDEDTLAQTERTARQFRQETVTNLLDQIGQLEQVLQTLRGVLGEELVRLREHHPEYVQPGKITD